MIQTEYISTIAKTLENFYLSITSRVF